jgi:hypothetical protein
MWLMSITKRTEKMDAKSFVLVFDNAFNKAFVRKFY